MCVHAYTASTRYVMTSLYVYPTFGGCRLLRPITTLKIIVKSHVTYRLNREMNVLFKFLIEIILSLTVFIICEFTHTCNKNKNSVNSYIKIILI